MNFFNSDKFTKEYNHERNIEVSEADLLSIDKLNDDQMRAFKIITEKIYSSSSGTYFIDGPGGSGITFLYRALLADVRSRGYIALAVATSGVAAALLPGGRTAHSRFKIPIDIDGKTKCKISKHTTLVKLLLSAKLIIWDEISMARRQIIEALDDILQDLIDCDNPFGGKVVVFGGDYRQIAPVVVGGEKGDTIDASFASSSLSRSVHRLFLRENMRAKDDPMFTEFLMRVGNGTETHVLDDRIEIPNNMILPFVESHKSLNVLIELVFPCLDLFLTNPSLVINRSILAPKNDCIDEINEILIDEFPGEMKRFVSLDKTRDPSQQGQYEDFLNSITISGLPPHILTLKVGCPIMLLRNINPIEGLCNGTRLICRGLGEKVIHAEIATGHFKGKQTFIPRIPLESPDKRHCPIPFTRTQFPVKPCFAMTVNKAQGQTLDFVGVYLREPVFSHGQLYVALSRAKTGNSVKVLIQPPTVEDKVVTFTRNIVYKEILYLANQE
ncbi:UNVERIFIED_CONTAM: ATP-dependent DNA helicase RRM3 [Sesamum radiatum]|uniref:ATP-dependent DNA helicase n=1 Tax=Sesamum radiatum TaxID=300843 RepID=A0AAW2RZE7_SESRA